MGAMGKLMTSATAARRAFVQTWRAEYLNSIPLVNADMTTLDWASYNARLLRYTDAWHYYSNTVYTSLQRYFTAKRADQKLYKHIVPLYNPTYRAVEAFVAKTYGGALDLENMTGGAVPIVSSDEAVLNGIRTLWLASNFGATKSLLTRYTAIFGDGFIKLVDEPEHGRVRMEILHPGIIEDIEVDGVGAVKRARIGYTCLDPATGLPYDYGEEINQDETITYKDGVEHGYDGAPSRWSNQYGFVPLVQIKFRDIGEAWGANAIYTTWRKVDYLNDVASLLHREIRKRVVQAYVAAGIKTVSDIELVGDRDELPLLKIPAGATISPLMHDLDIAGVQSAIDRLYTELENDMPVLAMARIRESSNFTAPGVQAAFSDAIGEFNEVRGNIDSGLALAQKMGLAIGALRRYRGYDGLSPVDYEAGRLDHYIAERPVISDALSLSETVNFLIQLKVPAEAVLGEMGYSASQAEEWGYAADEARAAERMAAQEQAAAASGNVFSSLLGSSRRPSERPTPMNRSADGNGANRQGEAEGEY